MPPPPLVLASQSPQRQAILRRLGVQLTVRPAHIEELREGDPAELARANALLKARAARDAGRLYAGSRESAGSRPSAVPGAGSAPETVLGCDTVVALDGVVYGKPAHEREARATLRALSGRTHEVVSGLALLLADGEERVAAARTAVTFRELDRPLLAWYLARGEWRERAGAYAIQGAGAALVRSVEGDYENVVGLPVATLLDVYPELLGTPGR